MQKKLKGVPISKYFIFLILMIHMVKDLAKKLPSRLGFRRKRKVLDINNRFISLVSGYISSNLDIFIKRYNEILNSTGVGSEHNQFAGLGLDTQIEQWGDELDEVVPKDSPHYFDSTFGINSIINNYVAYCKHLHKLEFIGEKDIQKWTKAWAKAIYF